MMEHREQLFLPTVAASSAVLEAPAVVAGFDNVAVVCDAVEQRSRHLGIPATSDCHQFSLRETLPIEIIFPFSEKNQAF